MAAKKTKQKTRKRLKRRRTGKREHVDVEGDSILYRGIELKRYVTKYRGRKMDPRGYQKYRATKHGYLWHLVRFARATDLDALWFASCAPLKHDRELRVALRGQGKTAGMALRGMCMAIKRAQTKLAQNRTSLAKLQTKLENAK